MPTPWSLFSLLKSKLSLYVNELRVIPPKGILRKKGLMQGIHACQKEVFLSNAETALQDISLVKKFL